MLTKSEGNISQNPTATDWAAARGDKWRAQISGMEPMLKAIDAPLISALKLDAPCRIADIGCGGGGTTLEISRAAPIGSVVHGFDVSPALIELAHERARLGQRAVTFEVANVSTVRPAQPYARLVSRFGIMFFDDAPAAFANLLHWLEPGGRFAFAVWGALNENPWLATVRDVVVKLIELPAADPEGPGPFRYADCGKLLATLEQAGFAKLDVSAWRGELPIGGGLPPVKAAHFALASFSSFGELLAKAGEDKLNAARQLLTSRFAQFQHDGVVRIGAQVHLVTGARP